MDNSIAFRNVRLYGSSSRRSIRSSSEEVDENVAGRGVDQFNRDETTTSSSSDTVSFLRKVSFSQLSSLHNMNDRSTGSTISSTSSSTSSTSSSNEELYYDVGVSGHTFRTGSLSKQYYDAIVQRRQLRQYSDDDNDDDNESYGNNSTIVVSKAVVERLLVQRLVWEMTTQDALQALLKQNGLELNLNDNGTNKMVSKNDNDSNNENHPIPFSLWGLLKVDSIRVRNDSGCYDTSLQSTTTTTTTTKMYDSFEQLFLESTTTSSGTDEMNPSYGWVPGMTYDFIVRNVPVRIKDLQLHEILDALDPDGTLHQQALEAGITIPNDLENNNNNNNNNNKHVDQDIVRQWMLSGLDDHKDDKNEEYLDFDNYDYVGMTLQRLSEYNSLRSKRTPVQVIDEPLDQHQADDKYVVKRGYRILPASELLPQQQNSRVPPPNLRYHNHNTLMHIMDAFVNHGCLIVDVTGCTELVDNLVAKSETKTTTTTTATTTTTTTTTTIEQMLAKMWNTVQLFFDRVNDCNSQISNPKTTPNDADLDHQQLPTPLQSATSVVGSKYAKVGYASYDNGCMQFLETRISRSRRRQYNALPMPSITTNSHRSSNRVTKDATEAPVTTTYASEQLHEKEEKHNSESTLPLLPEETLLSYSEQLALVDTFDVLTKLAKEIVHITVTASTMEAFELSAKMMTTTKNNRHTRAVTSASIIAQQQQQELLLKQKQSAYDMAKLLVTELIDDGKPLHIDQRNNDPGKIVVSKQKFNTNTNHLGNSKKNDNDRIKTQSEPDVCMSPHRLCRYTNNNNNDNNNNNNKSSREIFGAHTDSTFVTIVPVAAVPGLEVFDEDANAWYSPERAARRHYDATYGSNKNNDSSLPWHTRYVVYMPGELLQIVTRNEVLASVHRVVTTTNKSLVQQSSAVRLSAPILLRGRINQLLDCNRYLGGTLQSDLLLDCDKMTMEQIHDILR